MKKRQHYTIFGLLFLIVLLSLIVLKMNQVSNQNYKQNLASYLLEQEKKSEQQEAGLVKLGLDYQVSIQNIITDFLDIDTSLGDDIPALKENTDQTIDQLLELKLPKEYKEFHLDLITLLSHYQKSLATRDGGIATSFAELMDFLETNNLAS